MKKAQSAWALRALGTYRRNAAFPDLVVFAGRKSRKAGRSGPSRRGSKESRIIHWSRQRREEELVSEKDMYVADCSADAKTLLISNGIALSTARKSGPGPWRRNLHSPRKDCCGSGLHLFQPRFSPDGRWIVFEAVRDPAYSRESFIVF